MAKIFVVTAADEQKGEPQKQRLLEQKPVKWCIDHLKLEDDPIPLAEKIKLVKNPKDRGGTQQVFVLVTEDESNSITPGFYPIDKNPAEVRKLLRDG